jgi:hypothetical protein
VYLGIVLKHQQVARHVVELRNIHALLHGSFNWSFHYPYSRPTITPSIGFMPTSCVMLHRMSDDRLFLRPQPVSHCDSGSFKAVSSASVRSSERTRSVSMSIQINATGVSPTELLGTPDCLSINRCRYFLCFFDRASRYR